MVVAASIIIPIGPGHEAIAKEAIASACAQTVPVEVIPVMDAGRRGPAYARNRGVEKATTQYVAFLDADDLLDPTFVERTLAAARPGRYVYTWWREGDEVRKASLPLFSGDRAWHTVTVLIEKSIFERVGGFDEKLPGGEDTDLFMKLAANMYCPIELPESLMHYRAGGFRAHSFKSGAQYADTLALFNRRYRSKLTMACCGGEEVKMSVPNGRGENDILAYAMWGGDRSQRGAFTGRRYDGGNGLPMWIDPRDAEARPDLWRAMNADEQADFLKPKPQAEQPSLTAQIEALQVQLANLQQQVVMQPPAPQVAPAAHQPVQAPQSVTVDAPAVSPSLAHAAATTHTRPAGSTDYDSMTVAGLRSEAAERGIDLGVATLKVDIIAVLKAYDGN